MISSDPWDVMILGSGVAGLAAALAAHELGLRPLVLEKASRLGGGTVSSYRLIWVGQNYLAQAAGYRDTRDEVIAYAVSRRRQLRRRANVRVRRAFTDECPLSQRPQGQGEARPGRTRAPGAIGAEAWATATMSFGSTIPAANLSVAGASRTKPRRLSYAASSRSSPLERRRTQSQRRLTRKESQVLLVVAGVRPRLR